MKKRITIELLTVLGLYIASYLTISAAGTYRVVAWGLSGPKGPHRWMPSVFYSRYNEMRQFAVYFYAPLFVLDRAVWHKDTWSPQMPPPFVQGDITIVPPVRCRRSDVKRQTEGTTTHIITTFVDADGRRFTMRLSRSARGRIPRSPIYITTDGSNSKAIAVANQAAFFARVIDSLKEEPEHGDPSNPHSPSAQGADGR